MMHRKRGLRMWVLSMLGSSPKNGVEIMKEIESATQGWWKPSPGSVYPVLEQLTNEGLIKKRDDGRYELTAKASEEMAWPFGPPPSRPQTVEEMLAEITSYVSYFEELIQSDPRAVSPHTAAIQGISDRLSAVAKKAR
jgi:DNA-binding PadR family transcriptional regulator